MARFYADEDFSLAVVKELRDRGHDVVTTAEANRAGQRIPDEDQLSFARSDGRAILTFNRRDFVRLHTAHPAHGGIIACTVDVDAAALAERIDIAVRAVESLDGRLIRIVRPHRAGLTES
jgi:hypothetical protein